MNIEATATQLERLTGTLSGAGAWYEYLLVAVAVFLVVVALLPALSRHRRAALAAAACVLVAGEVWLAWFHYRLWELTAVADPMSGAIVTHVAVPLWVESEKLFVWALIVAVIGALMRRQREDLEAGIMISAAALIAGAALLGQPFTDPVPSFLEQYRGYLDAMRVGGGAAYGAFQGMAGSATFYYNAWYMWVHPPLLFLSYGCFVASFIATIQMLIKRHSSYETTAYRWARLGYLPLTFGMLIGFPWALAAWSGDSWWWSGKVNMSIMMWLLYTAYLHARLYLRSRGMWQAVAALAVLSFAILILTYLTTYVVPGAHSYALAPAGEGLRTALSLIGGGAPA